MRYILKASWVSEETAWDSDDDIQAEDALCAVIARSRGWPVFAANIVINFL